MTSAALPAPRAETHPVRVDVEPALGARARLSVAFRFLLALPHIVIVGGPTAALLPWTWRAGGEPRYEWMSGGALGAVTGVITLFVWFAIVFTGRHPQGLWNLAALYLRWRVRAMAYMALLRDEFPPFGEGEYPAGVTIAEPGTPRRRVSVAFRLLLAIPHLIVMGVLGFAWACTTIAAWVAILLTGRMPRLLQRFGVGVLRWNTRVEAYLLLLHDDYPPFSME